MISFLLTYMISFKTEIIFHVSRGFYEFTETFMNVSIARFFLEDTKESEWMEESLFYFDCEFSSSAKVIMTFLPSFNYL